MNCPICGMEININNLHFNQEALWKRNEGGQILSCPFCGAQESSFEKIAAAKEDTAEHLDERTLTILDHAMKLEVFNSDFYKQAALLAEKAEVKKMFEALSSIERMHARIHQRLGRFQALPALQQLDYSKYKVDESLLEAAAIREKHAVEYYHKFGREVCSERIRRIFEVLSFIESEHILLTAQ